MKTVLAFVLSVPAWVLAAQVPALLPQPKSVRLTEGVFAASPVVETRDAALPKEGYRLSVSAEGVRIAAADDAGAFYARRTLAQLADPIGRAPGCEISDAPAYPWRGLLLDEGRHFFGKDVVKGVLDRMADVKLNVFHWHLTDDQGWRVDVPGCPELVRYGSVRPQSVAYGHAGLPAAARPDVVLDGTPYGPFFYSAADIAEIVAYAKARFITVVPEFDMPGHVRALLAAHPEFSCRGDVARVPRLANGVEEDVLCLGNDAAVAYVEKVFDAFCDLFPGTFIHIGGDECPRRRWKECPKCQARMKALGLRDEAALHGWIARRITDRLAKRGRRAVGWDEVLAGKPGTGTVVQSWRGAENGARAAALGHQVIASDHLMTYFSRPQGLVEDPFFYPSEVHIPLSLAYEIDPCAGVAPALRPQVIGAECCVWSEGTWNRFDLAWKLWPRGLAFAEAVWSAPAAPRDFADFCRRAGKVRKSFVDRRVNCAPIPPAHRPPAAGNHAPSFFWIMNGPLTEESICAQMDDMKAHGLGGVCWHPFPKEFAPMNFESSMSPDYLSCDYLALYAKAADHAEKLGMDFWLYDEGGWPSGSACGLVMKGTGEKYARRYLEIGADGKPVVTVDCGDPAKRAPHPSAIEPGATERFLELTHGQIARRSARHFGRTIRYAFTDEPVFPISWPGRRLGWCTDFAEQFKARKGYDLLPFAKDLIAADRAYAKGLIEPLWANRHPVCVTPELSRVRIDYMDVRSQLFVERYLNPIRDWCRRNGLKSGGHFGGEDQVEGNAYFGYGHILRSLRALDCPGVDAIWRQIWPGEENIQFPRYAASAAHQNGNDTVLSETFAVYGASMTPDEMRWTIGSQLVRGVNKFVFSEYAYKRGNGENEREYPNFGPGDPAWDFETPFFTWVADMSEKMSKGRPDVSVAVLFDVRGVWAGGRDAVEAADAHVAASRELDRQHVDHDFIDDDQLAAAEIRDGRLVVGEMAYGTVVVPTEKWVLPAAKAKLEAFAKAGGQVARGTKPEGIAPTCRILGEGAEDIRVMRRRDGAKEIMLFFNESMKEREVAICGYGYKRFAPGECHYWETGMPYAEVRDTEVTATLGGWSPALGDWRARKGEAFSGTETYRTTFRHAGGKAILDLGRVCWMCRVRLNGRELEPKFFGPFAWEVELRAGENALEVTVANTLANRAAAATGNTSPYAKYFDRFNKLNHASGLVGPVTLRRRAKTADEKFLERVKAEKPFGEGYRRLWTDRLNADIDARIEKYRKQDYVFDGFKPGEEVEVVQVTSDFQVGCNMFNFGQLGKPEWDAQYRATWEKGGIFNAATIPFYWSSFEFERGKPRYVSTAGDAPERWAKFRRERDYRPVEHWTPECPWEWRRPAPDRLIAFCQKNGISMHGHCIIYPAWDPDWIKPIAARDLNELQACYDKRVRDIACHYKDTLQQWDVVNENWNRESGTEHPNDFKCVHDGLWNRRVLVPKDYTFKALKVAEKYFPKNVKICVNDAAQDGYFALAKQLSDRGARFEVMGFQMHIFDDLPALKNAYGVDCEPNGMRWDPNYQTNVFAKIDRLGRPIHLSEVTIPAPRRYLPEAEADAVQARLVRDNFRLWFSWPSVYRITYWNLVDGTGAEILASGFYNKDLTKKPVYATVDRLVNHEWRTRLRVKADGDGRISFRGFKGKYEFRRAK